MYSNTDEKLDANKADTLVRLPGTSPRLIPS